MPSVSFFFSTGVGTQSFCSANSLSEILGVLSCHLTVTQYDFNTRFFCEVAGLLATEPTSITELTSHLLDVCYQCIPRVDYTVVVRDCISGHGL